MAVCARCSSPLAERALYCSECGAAVSSDAGLTELHNMKTPDDVGQQASGARTLAPGETFAGRYGVLALVGEGGMGAVYRVRDLHSGEELALKIIRPDRMLAPSAVDQLVREGLVARQIRHPNVVSVYDVSKADGAPYLTMELLEGVSLRAWNRRRIARGEDCAFMLAAEIVGQILDGLEAAHARGVVHRDLKPENIILTGEPEPGRVRLKLLDFGLALATGLASSSRASAVGTPRYMAPEQETAPESVRPSADLFSLSLMFYELLSNVLPTGLWRPPSDGRPDVPAEADALILAGLSPRPASRPQSVAAYRQQLNAARAAHESLVRDADARRMAEEAAAQATEAKRRQEKQDAERLERERFERERRDREEAERKARDAAEAARAAEQKKQKDEADRAAREQADAARKLAESQAAEKQKHALFRELQADTESYAAKILAFWPLHILHALPAAFVAAALAFHLLDAGPLWVRDWVDHSVLEWASDEGRGKISDAETLMLMALAVPALFLFAFLVVPGFIDTQFEHSSATPRGRKERLLRVGGSIFGVALVFPFVGIGFVLAAAITRALPDVASFVVGGIFGLIELGCLALLLAWGFNEKRLRLRLACMLATFPLVMIWMATGMAGPTTQATGLAMPAQSTPKVTVMSQA